MQISCLLRAFLFVQLLSVLLWGAYWWWHGREMLAVLGALLILFYYVPGLALESLWMAFLNRKDPAPPASWRQCLRALLVEARLFPLLFYGRQAFRRQAIPDAPGLRRGSLPQRGVVLVHGFYCNRAFWTPWTQRLQEQGIPFIAVDLDPAFASIDEHVPLVEEAVQTLECHTGLPPVLVGHSRGGLVVRAWLQNPRAEKRVHRVITIGTPHQGTWLGRLARAKSGRQMKPDSAWLRRLEQQELPGRQALFTCFWSHCDNVVFPASTATLPGADNRHVQGAAHVEMIYRAEVFAEVLRWVGLEASVPGNNH